jgi:hypothetical protein
MITNFAADMQDEKFKRDLDELFRLFKKMVEKKPLGDVEGVDKFMIHQFQLFFKNYETMKDQIADQLQGQFGDSVKEMVSSLVQQLKEELDDDILFEINDPEPLVAIGEVGNDKKKIDELLKNPNLTEEQINQLLDKRSEL